MPNVYRVTLIDPRSPGVRSFVTGPVYIRKRDGVVHVIDKGPPMFDIVVYPDGSVFDAFLAIMICGCKAKVYANSRNRYTNAPVTCLTCLAGEFK